MVGNDYHHGDLRQALLDAAERLVSEEGTAEVSLRAIAREAGVSPAAPYHHFDDREALLAGVAAAGFRRLRDAMAAGASAERGDSEPGPLDRLQEAGIAYVRFAADNPPVFRLMFSGLLSDRERYPELQEAANGAFGVLAGLLGGGPPRGGAGAGDPDGGTTAPVPGLRGRGRAAAGASPVALATWSTVHGLAFLFVEGIVEGAGGVPDVEQIAREVTRVLGRGLGSYVPPEAT